MIYSPCKPSNRYYGYPRDRSYRSSRTTASSSDAFIFFIDLRLKLCFLIVCKCIAFTCRRVSLLGYVNMRDCYDGVIKWKHFPRYWPFVRGIHRSSVNYAHKDQWRGVNNSEADDLRRYRAHFDVIVMSKNQPISQHYKSSWMLIVGTILRLTVKDLRQWVVFNKIDPVAIQYPCLK